MRIALCSDEPYPVDDVIKQRLEAAGHEVMPFGAARTRQEAPWAEAAEEAARAVAGGECDEGVFLCFTGTGISIAANKVAGIRAALCTDPGTAAGARVWNHANVLCLSHRLLSEEMAKEILDTWFDTPRGVAGNDGVEKLKVIDRLHRAHRSP